MKTRSTLGILLLTLAALSQATLAPASRAATCFVAPDGSGDCASIQEAIDMSTHGDTIILADGVYRGVFNRGINFWGKAIVLRSQSDDPEACIIDCEATPEEPFRGFTLSSGETEATVVRGLTIMNGISPDT